PPSESVTQRFRTPADRAPRWLPPPSSAQPQNSLAHSGGRRRLRRFGEHSRPPPQLPRQPQASALPPRVVYAAPLRPDSLSPTRRTGFQPCRNHAALAPPRRLAAIPWPWSMLLSQAAAPH